MRDSARFGNISRPSPLCATVQAVESEIVGYQNKKTTESGLHYVTCTFENVKGSKSIQDLYQMDSSVPSSGANLQLLDKDGLSTAVYYWCKKGTAHASSITFKDNQTGVWAKRTWEEDEEGDEYAVYSPIDVDIEPGRAVAIQIYAATDKAFVFNGKVSDADVTVTNKVSGLMYVGNPFPQDIDLQDLQMDATVPSGGANVQFLDKDGLSTSVYYWCKVGTAHTVGITFAEGQNGVWAKRTWEEDEEGDEYAVYTAISPAVKLAAGDGVQLYCAEGKSVTILAPFSL